MNIRSLTSLLSFVLIVICFGLSGSSSSVNVNPSCIEKEREALFTFKNSLDDPSNRLSSWFGQNCCNWVGVRCDNKTGHVVELNLRSEPKEFGYILSDGGYYWDEVDFWCGDNCLYASGVNSSLIELKHLEYLDLSFNYFNYSEIPQFIGNFTELRYLNLSYTAFEGDIPYSIGNLTSLIELDLRYLFSSRVDTLSWLSHLQKLQYLDLSYTDLSYAPTLSFQAINLLPSLSKLFLRSCELPDDFILTLSSKFSQNLTSLSILNLQDNSFRSQFPDVIRNFTSLRNLDLSRNQLSGKLPSWFNELKNLQYLHLSRNFFVGLVPSLGSSMQLLEEIDLSSNQLSGPLPSSLGTLSNLRFLDLHYNKLNGSLPTSLGQLLNLEFLYLNGNSFTGNLSQTHFEKLSNLQGLYMDNNSLAFMVPSDWIPPFNLTSIDLTSCKVGPEFPLWLRTQKEIGDITLSKASISVSIPHWIWNLSSNLWQLDLSHNQIVDKSPFPQSPSTIQRLSLSNNYISGNIPLNISSTMPRLRVIDLSNNIITGVIPMSLLELGAIWYLDLSKNHLSGHIPPSFFSKLAGLDVLSLDNNNLSGKLPNSITPNCTLEFLKLSNNKFRGELPLSVKYCKTLEVVDVGENKLSGNIPSWIGELESLAILRLRSNRFEGVLVPELCNLQNLRILDLAANNLSGLIPHCFKNFSAMTEVNRPHKYVRRDSNSQIEQVMKGKVLEYTTTLGFLVNLDLSSNYLAGQIPQELVYLLGLSGLNLSKNQLTGEIPNNIGKLTSLESLDFSSNRLSGLIPQSISELYNLGYLNLSHNNFSGKIPTGRQLQTFEAPIYEGNEELCGDQIHKPCTVDEQIGNNGSNEEVDEEEKTWFPIGVIIGFIVGSWAVWGSLFFKKTWRYKLFGFVENTLDRLIIMLKYLD